MAEDLAFDPCDLAEHEIDLRVLDALGQAGLAEQTLHDLTELETRQLRAALERLEGRGFVRSATLANSRPGESMEVWVASEAGRDHLDAAFQPVHASDRMRRILLMAVDELSPTTRELMRCLRWLLPAQGLRRLRDVHEGWVRQQLEELADQGMVRAVPEQTHGGVVWLALSPVGAELARLDAVLGDPA
jgi:hypothetical protein